MDETPAVSFRLTSFQGASGTFKRMAPWFLTMAFVMVFGIVVQDRFVDSPAGQAFTFGVPFVALGYGAYRTMTLPPPPAHILSLSSELVVISTGNDSPSFHAPLDSITVRKSAYTMHSKYGSFTFPVLDLTSGEQHARLCVWDNRPEFAFPEAKSESKPHYLVTATDWPKLVKRFDT